MGGLLSSCFGQASDYEFASGREVSVLKTLGEGGFSIVYLVKDRAGTLYALKRLLLQLPEQEKAFENEVNAHRQFEGSPYVVQRIDSCVAPGARPGAPKEGLLLLEYYKDGTIQDLVEREGPMPEQDAVRVFAQLCEALAEFHARTPALAHRDIKPGNVVRGARGRVALMDLGSVAPANVYIKDRRQALALQETCAQHCTAPYRAPELFEVPTNTEITAATDIWSLGCVLYFMVTGRQAFDGSAMAAASGRYTYPQDMEHLVSDNVRGLIADCLATEMAERPSAQQLLARARAAA